MVPDARFADGLTKASFATMWARIRSPPPPPAVHAGSAAASRRTRPDPAGPAAVAQRPRSRRIRDTRRIGTAPEANATNVPSHRKGQFGHLLDDLAPRPPTSGTVSSTRTGTARWTG